MSAIVELLIGVIFIAGAVAGYLYLSDEWYGFIIGLLVAYVVNVLIFGVIALFLDMRNYLKIIAEQTASGSVSSTGESESKEASANEPMYSSAEGKDSDFKWFFEKFATDPAYQLSHIKFPLSNEMQKKDWDYAGGIFINGTNGVFIGSCYKVSDNKYIYSYGLQESDVMFDATFKKIKGTWMMTNLEEPEVTY
jgi:hypothetical protein